MRPGFLIIGAQKSGTTSLADSLGCHPDVFICEPREPEYFAPQAGGAAGPAGMSWESYEKLFAGAGEGMLCGEASTGTMLDAAVIPEIDRRLPGVKLLAILRDPAGRAYSGLTHDMKKGRVGAEEGIALFGREVEGYLEGKGSVYDWFYRGEYGRQLEPFMAHYGERLKVVIFEEMLADEQRVFGDILNFLGLSPRELALTQENQSRVPRGAVTERIVGWGRRLVGPLRSMLGEHGYRRFREKLMKCLGKRATSLDPELARRLREEGYGEDIAKLEKLLGRRIAVWH